MGYHFVILPFIYPLEEKNGFLLLLILQQNFHRFPHSLQRTKVVIGSSADLEVNIEKTTA